MLRKISISGLTAFLVLINVNVSRSEVTVGVVGLGTGDADFGFSYASASAQGFATTHDIQGNLQTSTGIASGSGSSSSGLVGGELSLATMGNAQVPTPGVEARGNVSADFDDRIVFDPIPTAGVDGVITFTSVGNGDTNISRPAIGSATASSGYMVNGVNLGGGQFTVNQDSRSVVGYQDVKTYPFHTNQPLAIHSSLGINGQILSTSTDWNLTVSMVGATSVVSGTHNVQAKVQSQLTRQDIVDGAVSAYVTQDKKRIEAFFVPNYGLTMDEAAKQLEYEHFNWVSWVTFDNDPWRPSVHGAQVNAPHLDPPHGGYDYQTLGDDSFDGYWNAEKLKLFTTDRSLEFRDGPIVTPGAVVRFKTALAEESFVNGKTVVIGDWIEWESTSQGTKIVRENTDDSLITDGNNVLIGVFPISQLPGEDVAFLNSQGIEVVPEPSTFLLVVLCVVALGGNNVRRPYPLRRRRVSCRH
jgi:hypothetical protein